MVICWVYRDECEIIHIDITVHSAIDVDQIYISNIYIIDIVGPMSHRNADVA